MQSNSNTITMQAKKAKRTKRIFPLRPGEASLLSQLREKDASKSLQAEADRRNVRNVLRSNGKLLPKYWVARDGKLRAVTR
jgi:hypothetical protein